MATKKKLSSRRPKPMTPKAGVNRNFLSKGGKIKK